MPSLTIKNIPQLLLDRLKERAAVHRRSVNSQVLDILERELIPQAEPLEEELMARIEERMQRMRARGVVGPEPDELEEWINEGHK